MARIHAVNRISTWKLCNLEKRYFLGVALGYEHAVGHVIKFKEPLRVLINRNLKWLKCE